MATFYWKDFNLHRLNWVNSRRFLKSLPYARWYLAGAFVENTFKVFHISLGVVRSLPWGPRGLAVRRLPRMQEVVGSNKTIVYTIYEMVVYRISYICRYKEIYISYIRRYIYIYIYTMIKGKYTIYIRYFQ